MFFRNLTMARFGQESAGLIRDQALDGTLQGHLEECRLKPVGPLELATSGFVPPLGGETTALYHAIGDFVWLALGTETRLLPPAVIQRETAKRIKALEEREGRAPGGKARKQIKDDVIAELLPKSHVKPGRTNAYLDLKERLLVVDTSSRKVAERFMSELRRALGSFPAIPLNAEVSPRAVMTSWIAGEPLPEGVVLGDECELKDGADSGAIVKCQRQDLVSEEIAKHLESGKQVTRLAVVIDDHISAVIGEDLVVRKFKLLDGALEKIESQDQDDVAAELDARFALMTGEARAMFSRLEPPLKLSAMA